MEVLQNRLDSFLKQKRGKSLKWPHPKTWKATPHTLAEAGFYFDPSPDDPDNATCFMCNKQVTEWAEEDDPFDIHWEKCAKVCAWANLRCGLRRDADSRGRFAFPDKSRLPTLKAMEKARLETFTAHGWKHDKNKKHSATSKKMAHAGFIFTPTEVGDDTGACLYCNIALGNWDEGDDPMKHHRDRDKPSDPCPFLALAFGSGPPPSKSEAKTTKRAPKAKPPTHTDILMPTKLYDGSDSDAPAPFLGAASKTPRKAASKSTAKTPRTMTRSSSRANLRGDDAQIEEDEHITPPPKKRGRSKSVSRPKVSEDEGQDQLPAPPPTRQRRPTTAASSRSKSISRPPSALDAANLFDDDNEPHKPSKPESKSEMPRKTSRSKSKAREVETNMDDGPMAEEPVARNPSRSKSKASEIEPDEELTEDPVPRKPSRAKPKPKVVDDDKETKKPSSRSQSKPSLPDESSDDGWFVAALPPPPPTRARAKSVSRPKGKTQDTDVDKPVAGARKEQKKQQDSTTGPDADGPESKRPPSRSQEKPPSTADADPTDRVVRQPSRTRSKAPAMTEPEPKKPASRAKAKTPLPPSDNELDDADDDDDMGMEQYLPPPPAAVKSKSKPPSKVDEVIQDVREPKGPRGRKPSSRSTSKSILSKSEAAVLTTEVVEEEPELYEPAAPPPARTRKASSRSGSTIPPVARGASTSTTATLKSKAKRDPSPSPDLEENYDMDVLDTAPDPTLDESVHVAPAGISRQASKSKPASNGVVPSSLQTSDAPTTTSRKPVSKTTPPAPAVQKPRSMSQSQLHGSKAKKDTEQEYGGSSDSGDGLKVVDISTDEDEPKAAPKVKGKGKTKSKEKKAARNNLEEKRQVSSAHTSRILRSEEVADDDNDDVEMAEVEETMRLDPDPLPATPPRTAPAASSVLMDESSHRNHVQASPEGFAFIPPLATDPFVNLEDLSEAEQDMTVEEWIRYQMGIEYDRFKRDGERQLSMFERRAEEVRQAIETL